MERNAAEKKVFDLQVSFYLDMARAGDVGENGEPRLVDDAAQEAAAAMSNEERAMAVSRMLHTIDMMVWMTENSRD